MSDCCFSVNPDFNAAQPTHELVDCCTLKLKMSDGSASQTFNLNALSYEVLSDKIHLKDGVNYRSLKLSDAYIIFNVTDQDALLSAIDAYISDCRCSPGVTVTEPPVTLNVLNCDGSTASVNFEKAPLKVEIVQTKPFVMCENSSDFELGCSSIDGRAILLVVNKDENGVSTQLLEADGVTVVADGSTLVKCNVDKPDIEQVEFCHQQVGNPLISYRQIVFVNTESQSIQANIWLNSDGVAVAAPSGIEPCLDFKPKSTIDVPVCENIVSKEVDEVTATYLLNEKSQQNLIYEYAVAEINYTLAVAYSGLNRKVNIAALSEDLPPINDFVKYLKVDWGDGLNSYIAGNPSFASSHEYQLDGTYNIKFYGETDLGNTILIASDIVTFFNNSVNKGTEFYVLAKSYEVLVAEALQSFCDGVEIIKDINGNTYNVGGVKYYTKKPLINELRPQSLPPTLAPSKTIYTASLSLASGSFATDLGFNGSTYIAYQNVKSVSVSVRKSDATNVDANVAGNKVIIQTTISQFVILEDDGALTWSVNADTDQLDLQSVTCTGDSACIVTYTFI